MGPVYNPLAAYLRGDTRGLIGEVIAQGENGDVNNPGFETIGQSLAGWSPMTAADVLEVVSNNADDAAAGTGARTILVEGLDANYDYQREIITLNGTSDVNTTSTWRAVNSARVLTAGSGGTNAGLITIEQDTGNSVQQAMIGGQARAASAHYTVPNGMSLLLTECHVAYSQASYVTDLDGTGQAIEARLSVQPYFFNVDGVEVNGYGGQERMFESGAGVASNGPLGHYWTFKTPIVVGPRSRVRIEVEASGANNAVHGGFRGLLFRS